MDLRRSLPVTTCDIVTPDGTVRATTDAAILPKKIVIFDTAVIVQTGDEIRRRLPNGTDETFEVLEATYFAEHRGTEAHYQIDYRKKGVFSHGAGGNFSINVTGQNSRVNISSVDHSTNLAVGSDVFSQLQAQLDGNVSDRAELAKLTSLVEEMKRAQGKSGFASAFQKFVSVTGPYLELVAPFLPALAKFFPLAS